MWVYRSNRNDAAQLPRSLNDLDFSAVNLNYALNAGLDPKKALLLEGADTNWNLVFAVRAKNKDTPPSSGSSNSIAPLRSRTPQKRNSTERSRPRGKAANSKIERLAITAGFFVSQ